jgi:hypothetical protein
MSASSPPNNLNGTYPEKDRRRAPRTRPNPIRLAVFPAIFICTIMFQNMGRIGVTSDTSSLLGHALVQECLGASLGKVRQLKQANLALLASANSQWATEQVASGRSTKEICTDLVATLNSKKVKTK